MRRLVVAGVVLMALVACGPTNKHRVPQNQNLITADEIVRSNATNALEAIERNRPAFLRTRGAMSIQNPNPPTPIIYVDGMRFGPVNTLSQVPALTIATIEYLNAIDASQRFGLGHEGGAILVVTKR